MEFLFKYPRPLEKCRFLRRYKRFFVDVEREDGTIQTIHCANSGSMKGCLIPGTTAWILDSQKPERKLSHTLELLELDDGFACLNTTRANTIVEAMLLQALAATRSDESLRDPLLPPAKNYMPWETLKREAVFDEGTRFDFCLTSSYHPQKCWMEVKSVSLRLDEHTWAFPDAVTERGSRHLKGLMHALTLHDEARMIFVIMRSNSVDPEILCQGFRAAVEIDPIYAALFEQARSKGVKLEIVVPSISPQGFGLKKFWSL